MIAQKDLFSVSNQFAISGGAAAPVSSSKPTNSALLPTTTPLNTFSTLVTSTLASFTPLTAIPDTSTSSSQPSVPTQSLLGAAATAIPGQKKELGKGGAIGIIIGVVAIFAAFALMGIFVLVKKMVDKKTATAEAAAHGNPEVAGTAPLTRGDSPTAGYSPTVGYSPTTAAMYNVGSGGDDDAAYVAAANAARQQYKKKQMMMEEESRSRSSSYSGHMSSPDTLVASRKAELSDGSRSRSNSGPSNPTSPRAGEYPRSNGSGGMAGEYGGQEAPGGWGEEVHAYSAPHPGVPMQFTGSTVGGGGAISMQHTGESGMSSTSTLRGKERERRLSPPVQSKLRLRTDSE
jgi:hypothetical protein